MTAKLSKKDPSLPIPAPLPVGLLQRADLLLAKHPGYASSTATLRVQTLGGFRVWYNNSELMANVWGREKAIHLFQSILVALNVAAAAQCNAQMLGVCHAVASMTILSIARLSITSRFVGAVPICTVAV